MSTATDHRTHQDHVHTHGDGCGHVAIPHGDHTDYAHDGHIHRVHGDHVDECAMRRSRRPRRPRPSAR